MPQVKTTKKKSAAKVGGGGLGTKKYKLNLKIAIPIIAFITLAGGYTVLRSFAASVSSTNRVIGWYQACRGSSGTNFGGVPDWASRLDAGTASYATFKQTIEKNEGVKCPAGEPAAYSPPLATPVTTTGPSSTPTASTKEPSAASKNRVIKWYQVCRGSSSTNFGGVPGWATRLDNGTATYATFRDTMKANNDGNCPATEPGTTATGDSTGSGNKTPASSNPLLEAQNYVTLGNAHVANAKRENAVTYQRSLRNPITRDDLNLIATKEGYVRSALAQMQISKTSVQGLYGTAISNTATKAQGPGIQQAINTIQGQISTLAGYVTNISNDYSRARRTYEANLGFFGKLTQQQTIRNECARRGIPVKWDLTGCDEAKARQQIHDALAQANGGGNNASNSGSGSSGGATTVKPKDRCLLNGSCGDNYPNSTMCKGKADRTYTNYDYQTIKANTANGKAYQRRSRTVRCSRGGENYISAYTQWQFISLDTYRTEKEYKGYGGTSLQ